MAARCRPVLYRSVRRSHVKEAREPLLLARRLHLSDDVVAEEHRYLGLELLSRARLTKVDNTDTKTNTDSAKEVETPAAVTA